MKYLRFLWGMGDGKTHAKQILLIFVVMGYVALGLLVPLFFSFMIDNVINLEPIDNPVLAWYAEAVGGVERLRENLWIGSLTIVLASLAYGLLMFVRGRWNGQISETVSENIRNRMYRHLELLPYAYHVRAKTGDLIQRCTSDVNTIRQFLAGQWTEMLYAIFTTLIAVYVLFQINARIAAYSLVCLPVLFFAALLFFRKIQKDFRKADQKEGELTADIQENLSGMRVVRAFNREKYEIDKIDRANREYRDLNRRLIRTMAAYWSLSDLVCYGQIALVVIVCVYAARAGEITVGDFWVFSSYVTMIVFPARMLGRILSNMGRMNVSIGRIQEVLEEREEDITTGDTPDLHGDIVFDHVGFKYDDGAENVLENVSFTIRQGTTTAIMGPTGSGKSSLVHLLTGLYPPTEGKITIAGHDITSIQKQWLRRNVGIVLQEPFLFSRSILDNIKIARPMASREEIVHAAKIADVNDVIQEFDRGYDTMVGEKGVTLSGGQKQRIAIARTILNDSPVLIFDDSLSAVDTETDSQIRRALKELSGKLTMIIITQRINSAQDADDIIVLENKRLTEEGTHEELIRKPGLYQRIYEIQTGGGEDEREAA